MTYSKKTIILNWVTAILWSWFLLSTWTNLPIPAFIIPNDALAAFSILALQILAHCDLKKILTLKDREMNFICIIGIATIICLILSKSHFGALFTIINLCLLWYLSDKWTWDKKQIIFLGLFYIYLYMSWMINPMQFNPDMISNPNTTGTITVFCMLALITCIRYLFPNKKWTVIIEFLLICFALQKLLIFHGRGSLVALIFYILLRLLVYTQFWKKEKLYNAMCYILTLGSLLFVFIYTSIWKLTGVNFVIPFWNKSIFSGREKIWYEIWTYFKHQPFIGIGSNVTLHSWFEYNVHNAIYDILVTHGIIVFILVMVYMLKKMTALYAKYKQRVIFIPAVSGIFAIYLESFFDMDLLWFPQFLVWTFMLVLLASSSGLSPDKD